MYLLTKGSLSKIRNDAAGVKQLKAEGFALAGECDEEGNLTSTSVVLEDDEDDATGGDGKGGFESIMRGLGQVAEHQAERKTLVDAALAAGVIDPATGKPASEAALDRWGIKRLTEATEAAVKAKGPDGSVPGLVTPERV